jgi:hypothetical protein
MLESLVITVISIIVVLYLLLNKRVNEIFKD